MANLSLQELIHRARSGDLDAFQEIVTSYYQHVYYIALKISRNRADAKDITQDTFLQVQKSLRFLKEDAVFEQWLHRIIISKASDLFRKNKTSSFPEEHSVFQTKKEERLYMVPEKLMHFTSDQDMMQYFINQLDEKYRDVLYMSYFDHKKIKEIANLLDVPEGTVKSRMNMGKQQLKQMIERYQEREGVLLDFNSADLAGALTAFFMTKCNRMKPFSHFFTSAKHVLLAQTWIMKVGMIIMCATLSGTLMFVSWNSMQDDTLQMEPSNLKQQRNEESGFPTILYQGKPYQNAEDVYYALTLWAHCQEEMKSYTMEEIAAITPLYQALKAYQGVYWSMLQARHWDVAFEASLQNNEKI